MIAPRTTQHIYNIFSWFGHAYWSHKTGKTYWLFTAQLGWKRRPVHPRWLESQPSAIDWGGGVKMSNWCPRKYSNGAAVFYIIEDLRQRRGRQSLFEVKQWRVNVAILKYECFDLIFEISGKYYLLNQLKLSDPYKNGAWLWDRCMPFGRPAALG